MSAKSQSSTQSWIDPDDVPELTDDFFQQGVWKVGERPVSATDGVSEMRKALSRSRPKAEAPIDPDDVPDLTDDFFDQADEYVGDTLVRRGRPKAEAPKLALTMRYDADIVEAFRATGKGWQTRMNAALRDWLKTHRPSTTPP